MQNWQYLTVAFVRQRKGRGSDEWRSMDSNRPLDAYGSDGWELVSIIPEKWMSDDGARENSVIITAFFKRPKPRDMEEQR